MITTAVRKNMYVDDLLKSLDSMQDASRIYRKMKILFADSGFTITKWSANSQEVLEQVPEQDRAPQARDLGIHSFLPGAQGTMGLKWIPEYYLLTLRGGKEKRKGDLCERDVFKR